MKSKAKDSYLREVMDIARDRMITSHEYHHLTQKAEQLGLKEKHRREVHIAALRMLCQASIRHGFTKPDEIGHLTSCLNSFGLTWQDVPEEYAQLDDMIFEERLKSGDLEEIPRDESSIILQPDETSHLEIPAWIIDKVFTGMTGGEYRSYPVIESQIVSRGVLVMTNKQFYYVAQNMPFQVAWDQFLDVNAYNNAVELQIRNADRGVVVQFQKGLGRRVHAMMRHFINKATAMPPKPPQS